MATLTAYTKFDRNTIADGDKLSANIAANASNDNAMLAESLSTYSKIKSTYDTVKAYSANEWDNNKLHNFSKLVINGTTVQGKPKLADKFTVSAKDGVGLRKNAQNSYEFEASPEVMAVSSYYKYSRFSADLALLNQDPFAFECDYFYIAWLSWAQHESYCQNGNETLDGFSKTNADTTKFDTLTDISKLNTLAYKSTTRILTSADLPTDENSKNIKRLSHTIPWNGSFVYSNFDASIYKGAAIVTNNSISYLQNNFAQNNSIAISLKGASAYNKSFVFGDATTVEQNASTYHLGMRATDKSTCFGPGAVAHNKSITITPTGTRNTNEFLVSAFNKSISLESCGSDRKNKVALYLDNSFACQVNGDTQFSAVSSIVLQCAAVTSECDADSIQAYNSILTHKISFWYSTTTPEIRYYRKYKHSITTDSVDIMTNLTNVSNSVCIGVKGTSFGTTSYCSAVNSVVMQSEFSDIVSDSIKNSILLGLTQNYNSSGNNFDDTYAIYAGGIGSLQNKNVKDIYAVANIMYNYNKHTCFLCTETYPSAYADITDYYDNFAACKCLRLPGSGNIAIKGNSWEALRETNERIFFNNLVIGQPYINTNSAIGTERKAVVANNIIYQPAASEGFVGASACFIFADSNIHGYNYNSLSAFEANNSIALQNSNCYSNNSIAICNGFIQASLIKQMHSVEGVDTTPNYCFAYAYSTAAKYKNTSNDTSDIEQLSMWHNTLKKAHLTKSKFKYITEITSLDDMQENTYYIVG